MDIKRAYRFRFYPTPEQEALLVRTFGCTRFAYNYMLRLRTDAWFERRERIGYHETSALLTQLKKQPEYAWLNEVAAVPVQQALRHLNTAFNRFFARHARYPTFKTKRSKQAAEYTTSAFRWDGYTLRLIKMKDPLNIRFSRDVPKAARVTTVTVSRDRANRYFVSMCCDDSVTAKPVVTGEVGIDLGLTHFAVLSTGEKIAAPNIFRRNEARIALLQRRFSRKQKGSRNRARAGLKLSRLHAKIADSRRDFLHKLSTRLINENQVIAVESLAISNLRKNHHVAKSIVDAGWAEFVRQLAYKSRWYGRTLIGIDRRYPSTKRCSCCGYTVSSLSLDVRRWTCPECGVSHDRDVNAALNILAAGLAVAACGESVSPMLLQSDNGSSL